jgi:hypothetical protein
VLGQVDTSALRALADAHARARSTPAFAMLLDVDSWSTPWADISPELFTDAEPAQPPQPVAASEGVRSAAAVLQSAGWRVVIVRRGESVAEAWRTMLSGSMQAQRGARTGTMR